jgi:hypothetical protein
MDTTQAPEFDPDAPDDARTDDSVVTDESGDDVSAEAPNADVAPPGDDSVSDLLATLESVDPADAPEVAERLATLLSDELES